MTLARITTFADRNYINILAGIFFLTIIVLFTFPVREGDFFWHVKTGQWIWEHKSLPFADPFSSTTQNVTQSPEVVERTRFYLTQYWLGQLALFGTWRAAGEAGMVALRAIVYTGVLAFMYWWLRRGKNGIIPLATVFLVANVLVMYPNERPQIFAYLFMLFLLYLLEQLSIPGAALKWTHIVSLLLNMLVWGNCHGSFILGIAVIAAYLLGHIVTSLRNGTAVSKPACAAMTSAMLIALLNPNGVGAFKFGFLGLQHNNTRVINEYVSFLSLTLDRQLFFYGYWVLLIISIVTICTKLRAVPLQHLLVIFLLASLSLFGIRYIPFFLFAAPLALQYLPDWDIKGRYTLFPVLFLTIWLSLANFNNSFKFRAAKAFPTKAVQFLNTAKPAGKIFNDEFWGGYLMCYTDYPVFVDGRAIIENFNTIAGLAFEGINWKWPFEFLHINVIIMPGCHQDTGKTYPLFVQLTEDNDWALVYLDEVAVVFVRNIPQNRDLIARFMIPKDQLYSHLVRRWAWLNTNDL